jgi:transposase
MHLDFGKTRVGSKVYTRVLLRESFRHQGKVKHRTIANLSRCSPEEIAAIKLALQNKHSLGKLAANPSQPSEDPLWRQGQSVGAVAVLAALAEELGIAAALGCDRQGKLALWQVIARVIDQGSRLSAVRLAATHACCDLLDLDAFNEDVLYQNLAWIAENQPQIEDRLFSRLYPQEKPALFLYDVTSSYLEGTHNAFGRFGYNRDGKRGKHQIVIGLLCDGHGRPLSIEVFAGNTSDPKTFGSQIQKVAGRFGGGEVSLVGDRGMIKGPQIEQLAAQRLHYITAISKPQIEKLLKDGVFDMELFDEALAEVGEEQIRYILRRNPRRAQEMQASRASKLQRIQFQIDQSNAYLAGHPRATLQCALKKVRQKIEKLNLAAWASALQDQPGSRCIRLEIDEQARAEEAKLDGCYALKTDLSAHQASKEVVHARYKDLTLVEQAFRTSKTVELEMRPIHVRCEQSTRGHALVVMLAYRLAQELSRRWSSLDLTVGEGVRELDTLCAMEMCLNGIAQCQRIPEPRADVAELIRLAGVKLPQTLRIRREKVSTKKKLDKNRVKR